MPLISRRRQGINRDRRHGDQKQAGANATLGVSLAVSRRVPISGPAILSIHRRCQRKELPVPMMNILNGGKHADNNVDIQSL
jgi:enolase